MSSEEVIKAGGAFGGGLAGHGEVCGVLIGALGILGLMFSRSKKEEKVDPRLWSCARGLMKHFRQNIVKAHGGITCREIVNVDWTNPDQIRSYYKGEHGKILECQRILADTLEYLEELIERS